MNIINKPIIATNLKKLIRAMSAHSPDRFIYDEELGKMMVLDHDLAKVVVAFNQKVKFEEGLVIDVPEMRLVHLFQIELAQIKNDVATGEPAEAIKNRLHGLADQIGRLQKVLMPDTGHNRNIQNISEFSLRVFVSEAYEGDEVTINRLNDQVKEFHTLLFEITESAPDVYSKVKLPELLPELDYHADMKKFMND